jgi:4-hydroxyphenylacetate 3-monooxygenase
MAAGVETKSYVKTGDEYKQSLRDGRVVYSDGDLIEDVTTHPLTAPGVETLAGLHDDQHKDETRELLTHVREDGARVTSAYMLPRTPEELDRRREMIEHNSRQTFGSFGRGMDMIATLQLGFVAHYPRFERDCPEYADNVLRYRDFAEENNFHLAETIADPQGFRGRGGGTSPDTPTPARATTQIVKESDDGIWISGCKVVGTAAVYAQELLVGSPYTTQEAESFWAMTPMNAPGLKIFLRETAGIPGANTRDHPVDAKGDEFEAVLAFDEVFIPNERIFSKRLTAHHDINSYNEWARYEHWYTLVRIMVKAELYAGVAQLVVDTLELGGVSMVRQRATDIFEYATILRSLVMTAEAKAKPSPYGLLEPDEATVTAGRGYALQRLPWIYHTLQDLCGQGLMLRFSPRQLETPAAFGKNLSWFLDTKDVSAEEKNRVMNLVWDLTCTSGASRSMIFEEQNALPVPFLRERLYGEYPRDQALRDVRSAIGLGASERKPYAPTLKQALGSGDAKKNGN